MPPRGDAPDIVRIVEGLDGSVPMRSELVIRFDYGRIVPWVRRAPGGATGRGWPDALCFRTPVEVRGEGLSTVSEFTLEPGQRVPFVLTWFPSHEQPRRASTRRRHSPTPRGSGLAGPTSARTGATTMRRSTNRCSSSRRSHTRQRAARWPRQRRRCPNGSAVCAIGLSLLLAEGRLPDAGRNDERGLPRRGAGLARVAAAAVAAIPPKYRSCMALLASDASMSASYIGFPVSADRGPCASGTRPRRNSSSTSTARCSTPATRPAYTESSPRSPAGQW